MSEEDIRRIATQVYNDLGTRYGIAKVPVHTHNGIDTVPVPFTNLQGAPTTYSGQSGKVLAANSNENGLHFIAQSTATPGGADTNVQYNDGGNFGGDANLTWDKTLGIAKIKSEPSGGIRNLTLYGDAGGLTMDIATNDAAGGSDSQGTDLSILSGNGDTSKAGGQILIETGNGGATSGNGGLLNVIAGNGSGTGAGGEIDLSAGDGGATGNGGSIVLTPGAKGASGGTPGDINANAGSAISTSANGGFLAIPHCAGTPTGTPTLAGSMVFDTTNLKLYIWTGAAWKSVLLS